MVELLKVFDALVLLFLLCLLILFLLLPTRSNPLAGPPQAPVRLLAGVVVVAGIAAAAMPPAPALGVAAT